MVKKSCNTKPHAQPTSWRVFGNRTIFQVIKAVKVGLELLYPFVTKIYVNKLQSTVVTQMHYVYKD